MIDPAGILIQLRRCGIAAHHAAWQPGRQSIVVFLEGALDQGTLAAEVVQQLPGVRGVRFSGRVRSIMFVNCATA